MAKLHVVLIGPPGCGKSSVGRHLAELTGKPYLDIDRLVEAQMRMPITEIFSRFGEARFRELEHRMINGAMTEPAPAIVSTGAGAVVDANNRSLLWQHGTVIYLQADVALLYERLAADKSRPLLQTPNPRDKIAALLAARAPYYEQADLIVPVRGKTIEQTCAEILSR